MKLFEDIDIINEDTAYQEIYDELGIKTEGWTLDSGEVRYSEKKDADIAESILSKKYNNVKTEPLDFKDGEDLSYHVVFSDMTNEKFDIDGLNWYEDKNPTGTPIGNGTGMAEDFEPADDYIQCPYCQGAAEYIEGQGNFRFYKCLDCGEYLFINKKGVVKKADDAFDEEGNLLKEDKEEDSNDKDYFDALHKPEQDEKVEELNNKFKGLGFDIVSFEQCIPSKDYNMYFKAIKFDKAADNYDKIIGDELKKIGAKNIDISQVIDYNNEAYVNGAFFLDGMTLEEKIEESLDNDITEEMMDNIIQKYYDVLKRLGDE